LIFLRFCGTILRKFNEDFVMAVIKKKVGNEIKEFPYDRYGLDQEGNYKVLPLYKDAPITLKPDGYNNNPSELKYTCSSTVAELLEEGKTAIYTDDSESHTTLWRTIRDGVMTSNKNDNLYLGYENDSIGAGLGDDFIEIDNHNIFVDGDLDMGSAEGGIDVFMIRCGSAYVAGNGNSDHYFVNISQKCKDKGFAKYITINEISFNDDANKLHLCDFSFKSVSGDLLDILTNNAIQLNLPTYDALELYFKGNPVSSQKPDIIINNFCDNSKTPSINPPIAAIIDKDGIEISLQGLNCSTIATYLTTHNSSLYNNDNNRDISSQEITYNTNHTTVSTFTDCIADIHILSTLGHLLSNIGDYFGFHHSEL
jgi:hypothetical protein